jgi:Protein of unknown function (DUF4232)
MTHLPTDPIDPDEARLAARVRSLGDRAVRPIDAAAIAHAVAVEHPRRRFGRVLGATTAMGRLGWIAAATLLAVAAIGGAGLSGAGGKAPSVSTAVATPTLVPTPIATVAPTTAPVVTPAPTVAPLAACAPGNLAMRVLSWTGAAGQRDASLRLTNTGSTACTFRSVTKPELVDGTGKVLIAGASAAGGTALTVRAGASLSSMAQDGNYCGPAPVAPITVAIVLPGGERVVAAPVSPTDTMGLPPCMGSAGAAYIQMHAWQP